MKNKFTILGCGSSHGVPTIMNYWGASDNLNKKNRRTRCSAFFTLNGISILIDTSPDIRSQFISNGIKKLDAVLYSHEHSDQTSGIFELRPFAWKKKEKINIFGSTKTIKELIRRYDFCFKKKSSYVPILRSNIVKKKFSIIISRKKIDISTFEVLHGKTTSTVYIVNKVAYISDCSFISEKQLMKLKNLNYLIIDCFRNKFFPTHLNYKSALRIAKILKPKKTILTNLHLDLDYETIKKKLPSNIVPAFDGMSFNF